MSGASEIANKLQFLGHNSYFIKYFKMLIPVKEGVI